MWLKMLNCRFFINKLAKHQFWSDETMKPLGSILDYQGTRIENLPIVPNKSPPFFFYSVRHGQNSCPNISLQEEIIVSPLDILGWDILGCFYFPGQQTVLSHNLCCFSAYLVRPGYFYWDHKNLHVHLRLDFIFSGLVWILFLNVLNVKIKLQVK